jgi:signal transduction histidine kinase
MPAPDDQQRLEALKRFFVLDHAESEDEIARLVRVAAGLYGVAYAALTLREAEGERLVATYGFDAATVPPDAVFCERPVGRSVPLAVADASTDERFARNPLVHGAQQARFYAGVPLKSSEGFTLGTLALLDPTPQELNGEGLAMLVDLAVLVEPALNLQRARTAQAEAEQQREAAEGALRAAQQALQEAEERHAVLEAERDAAHAECDIVRADGDALTMAYQALAAERDAMRDALTAERDALVAERDALASERDALTAAADEVAAAWEAATAERDTAQADAAAAIAEHEATREALAHWERLAAAALAAADRLAVDPTALPDALGLVAAETGAARAVLVVKAEAGPTVRATWHAEGFFDLADPGDLLDADELDGWADAHGVDHLAALPLPGGLVLLDAPAWAPGDEAVIRAAFAPLAVALRRIVTEAEGPDRSRLLASVSHEVRTTLTSLLGFAEMLAEEAGPSNLETRRMADAILGSSARLLQTLDSILDITRLEASGRPAALAPVDMGTVIEAAAAPFRAHADARDLAFFTAGTELGAHAWADATALGHALGHLLANAFTFTDQGGVRLRVHAEDDWVGVEVQDTGVGIAPEFLPHLFDEFRREEGERERNGKGSGLGLALTKRLVELMGGEIAVTSLKGQGSVFRVLLRSAPAAAPAPFAALPGGDGFTAGVAV